MVVAFERQGVVSKRRRLALLPSTYTRGPTTKRESDRDGPFKAGPFRFLISESLFLPSLFSLCGHISTHVVCFPFNVLILVTSKFANSTNKRWKLFTAQELTTPHTLQPTNKIGIPIKYGNSGTWF